MTSQKHKAVFLDKDGTLIPDIPYNVDVDRITIDAETIKALQVLQKDFLIIVISNQSGIAKGYFNEQDLEKVRHKINRLLKVHHISIDGFYYCPHHPGGAVKKYAMDCTCRKPMPGLILKAAEDHGIDLAESWMIGDILHDVEAGKRAGCRTILLDNGNETEWMLTPLRTPDFTVRDLLEAASIIETHSVKTVFYG